MRVRRRPSFLRSWSRLPVAATLAFACLTPAFGQSSGVFDVRTSKPQEQPEAPAPPAGVFAEIVDVKVVNVDVVVTDKAGVPVGGLGPEDFVLEVDGARMPITNFYAETAGVARETLGGLELAEDSAFRSVADIEAAPPRRSHVVILVDHTRLAPANRKRAFLGMRDAVERLDPNDLVAVVGIEGRLVFYSDFLYDRASIETVLEQASKVARRTDLAETERRQLFDEMARGMSGGIQAQASLAEADAILARIRAYAEEEYARSISSLQQIETVIATLTGIPGRKTLIYVGEGIPTRPGEGLFLEWVNRFGGGNPEATIGLRRFDYNTDYRRSVGRYELDLPANQLATAANRAGVTLYAVDAEGSHSAVIRSALTEQGATSEALSVMDENFREPLEYASEATGGKLLRSSGMLPEQLAKLVNDFDTYYSLGFTAPDDWERGTDHRISVKVRGKGLEARHREQVRLPAPDEQEAGATQAALRYKTVDNPLGFRATPGEPVTRSDGALAVPIDLEIPIAKLEFLPQGEAQAASLSIYVSTKRANGDSTRVQKVPFHLPPVPNDVMDQIRGDFARYALPVVVRPGDQQVAIGIRDNVSGQFSAIRVDVSRLTGSAEG